MADQAVNEMISAFSTGCMDKENLTQFVHYLKNKGELPYRELGKMQTLVSLLPVILESERPPIDLKNKVARALISMQDEIKEKIIKEKRRTVELRPAKSSERVIESKPEEEPVIKRNVDVPAQPGLSDSPGNINVVERQDSYYMNENRLFTETPPRAMDGFSLTPVWIIIALMFLALAGLAYFTYSTNASLKESLAKTESSLIAIKGELRNAGEYINRNSALVDFFNYENVWVVSLAGVDKSINISGKLYIAPKEREALLQINNLPTPSPDNIYQLWLVTRQQTYSVGNFFVEPANHFVKMINLPQIPKEQIESFQISLEPRGGSPLPAGMVYAVGTVNESAARPVKRK